MRSARRKRASAEDLYRACKQGGDCIPDVVQKYEHNTIADNILKWGSSAVYFGGLGIGTGGARPTQPGWTIPREAPYRPLPSGGTGGGRPGGGWQIPREGTFQLPRPNRPVLSGVSTVDTVLPGDFSVSSTSDIAIGTVGPDTPSVILPESVPTDTDTVGLSIVTENPESVHITVDTSNRDSVAVLEIPPNESSDRITSITTRSGTSKHTYQIDTGGSIIGETSETANVFVNGSNVGGDTGENIELSVFSEPRTSTPSSGPPSRGRGPNNWFSRRYYNQVAVTDSQFLVNPRRFITEGYFDNPAFEEDEDLDESLFFPEEARRTYPRDPNLLDIGRLSRVKYTKSPSGSVGVSRIGTKLSMKTRSGLDIGGQLHFRYRIEPILEEIELDDLASSGDLNELDQGALLSDTSFMDNVESGSTAALLDTVSDSVLIDDSEDSLPLGHLTFSNLHTVQTLPVGSSEAETSGFTVTDVETTVHLPGRPNGNAEPGISGGVVEDNAQNPSNPKKRKVTPLIDLEPSIYIGSYQEPYYFYWHPHLLHIRKKKKTLWSSFLDGAVEARA